MEVTLFLSTLLKKYILKANKCQRNLKSTLSSHAVRGNMALFFFNIYISKYILASLLSHTEN